MIKMEDSIRVSQKLESIVDHDLFAAFISVVWDGNVPGHRGSLSFSPLLRSIYLFIYVLSSSSSWYFSIMDNKTFRALKSNNRTRTRVSQKIGRKSNAWFYALSPFVSLSLSTSLFVSSLGHDIDRTTDRKRTAKGKKRKVARLTIRPEHIGGGEEEGEMKVTRRTFFWKQTPIHRTSSQLPLEHPSPKTNPKNSLPLFCEHVAFVAYDKIW